MLINKVIKKFRYYLNIKLKEKLKLWFKLNFKIKYKLTKYKILIQFYENWSIIIDY